MYTIIKATEKDYATLPQTEAAAAQAFTQQGLPQLAKMAPMPSSFYKNLPNTAIVFIAKAPLHEILGFIVIIEVDKQAHIKELSVAYQHKQQGIGTALLKEAIKWASLHYTHLTLTTFRDLPFNEPFYKKHGFRSFTPNQKWPQLQQIIMAEKIPALEALPRVAMCLRLKV